MIFKMIPYVKLLLGVLAFLLLWLIGCWVVYKAGLLGEPWGPHSWLCDDSGRLRPHGVRNFIVYTVLAYAFAIIFAHWRDIPVW